MSGPIDEQPPGVGLPRVSARAALAEALDAYECVWGAVAARAASSSPVSAEEVTAFAGSLRASAGTGRRDLLQAERELLGRIAAACPNRLLAREALGLRATVERSLPDGAFGGSRDLVLAVHRRLVRAVEASDPGLARDAIGRHAWLVRGELGLLPAVPGRDAGAVDLPRAAGALSVGSGRG